MKKLLKITALLLFAQLAQLHAQTSTIKPAGRKTWGYAISLSPGVTFDNARFALGADFQVERRLTDLLGLTFSAGFTTISQEEFSTEIDQNMIPLKIGVKIYPAERYYLAGGVGTAIDINGNSCTAWSAAVARQLSSRFDLGLKYENYASSSLLAVRLGYRIF